jgi:hypothetical protein
MSVFAHIARPFRQAYALIFRRHVTLRMAQGGVRVVLQERAATPAQDRPPSREELAARKAQQEFNLMQQQLAELLNDLPETRTTLRHLDFVEKALERKGLRALQKLPVDLLQRALDQLEGLVVNWSPVGLAALRSRMAVAIIDRENRNPDPDVDGDVEANVYRTCAVLDTLPDSSFQDGLDVSTDDDALAAAYAALGDAAPGTGVEMQSELGSMSAKALARELTRATADAPAEIRIHALQR